MISFVLKISYVLLVLSTLLGLIRLARGPGVLDRVLAFDLVTTSVVGMIVLLSLEWQTGLFLELILIFTLLGFFGTVAFAFYLHRTHPAEEIAAENLPQTPDTAPHD